MYRSSIDARLCRQLYHAFQNRDQHAPRPRLSVWRPLGSVSTMLKMESRQRTLTSRQIREIFLEFFERKGHLRIAGASLLPRNDPTLLYINSGMAPLKPYFTGEATPPHPDLCNVQPCIRTIDIDVGDRHHLTLFEMLGSWSINHYWKPTAIGSRSTSSSAASVSADRHASVYGGDPSLVCRRDLSARVGAGGSRSPSCPGGNWGAAGDRTLRSVREVFFDTGGCSVRRTPGGQFDTSDGASGIWNAGSSWSTTVAPTGAGLLPFRASTPAQV